MRLRCSSTICQTFDRQANEIGCRLFLANLVQVVKKTVPWVECKRIKYTTNTRSFYSTTNNQRNAPRRQQQTETRYIELGAGGPGGWLARTANERLAHSGCYDFGSFDLAVVCCFASDGQSGAAWGLSDPCPLPPERADSDLADGVRVLFSFRRLLAASLLPGHTD
ncbi:hypothetical protein T05_12466 [Trichinella murrelli]|uniref:Uncharacterized protein n=1 Tax=Trichinella murrelli TaxID=144512 RepID=A0A0V0T6U0_9BILA|nr:hypothetical protein T05_12466 [Trichinella murrelli]